VAVDPSGTYVFVTCSIADGLAALYTSSLSGLWIPGSDGDEPFGVAVDPKGSYVYVANFGNDSVTVGRVSTTDPDPNILGDEDDEQYFDNPSGIAAVFDELTYEEEGVSIRKIYVANNGATNPSHMVTVITQTGSGEFEFGYVSNYAGSDPLGVTASPDGRRVYVANSGNRTVSVINTSTDQQVSTETVGNAPWGVSVGAMGNYLYVTNSEDDQVSIIDLVHDDDRTATAGTTPYGVAAPKNGEFAYVVNNAGTVPIRKIYADSSGTDKNVEDDGNPDIQSPYALGTFIGGTPPTAPSSLAATVEDDDTIELTWNDNSTNEEGFKIERRIQGEGRFQFIDTVGEDDESYTDYNLSSETTYEYRVCAYTEAADSSYDELIGDDDAVTTEESEDFSWCFIGSLF
jgi:YVTN family beta-propeller protein